MRGNREYKSDVLRGFLMNHRAEVTKSMALDFTIDRRIELERDDAREEGREKGLEQGIEQGLEQGLEQGAKQISEAVKMLSQGIAEEALAENGIRKDMIEQAKEILQVVGR